MRNLNYELKQLCQNNRDGSYSTQANRKDILKMMANDLHCLGYRGMAVRSLKQKHVDALIEKYKSEGLSIGTLKNRLSVLRWWARKINRVQVVAKDNGAYGIGAREQVAKVSKAKPLELDKLDRITNPCVKMSLELQRAFGLRREEAIKFVPSYADQGSYIQLKSSWCKGGKARVVVIRSAEQREVLDRARELAGKGSLIPAHLKYVQQLKIYEYQLSKVGLYKMHGLRHAYAQTRYQELTGRLAPACGGLSSRELSQEQKRQDWEARLVISKELGHEREQITTAYFRSLKFSS